jgi:hypothetical protein
METKNSVSWSWTDRDGIERTIDFGIADFSDDTLGMAREAAASAGYPGHRGGWWNYLVDDIRRGLLVLCSR